MYDFFSEKVKTKRYTHSRLRRILLCAFLGIDKSSSAVAPPYIRVLGFNREGKYCLKIMGKCASIPIIHNCSDFWELRVDDRMKRLFEMDIAATNLRSMLVGEELYRSFKTPPVYVK